MAEPKNRLRVKRIERVALVDKGDNPTADIVIHKRTSEPAAPAAQQAQADGWGRRFMAAVGRRLGWKPSEIAKAMDEAVTFDAVRGAQKASEEIWRFTDALCMAIRNALESNETDKAALVSASLDQFTTAMKEALPAWLSGEGVEKTGTEGVAMADDKTKVGGEAGPVVAPPADAVTKAEMEALSKRVTEAEAKQKEAEAKVQKMETEKRDGEFIAKALALRSLPQDATKFGPILRKIADALTAEEFTEVERVLAAANEVARVGKLFDEVGSAGEAGSAAARVQAEADKLKAGDPKLTDDAAKSMVYKRAPTLMREVEAEEQELRQRRAAAR